GSLYLADDHSGYLNRRMYEEFALPYNLRLFERFGTRYRYLHMDSPMHHIADIVRDVYRVNHADLGVESDIRLIAREFKGRVSFNGNANWRALLSGSRTLIEVEVERCIYYAAPGGGYIFDNGGETYAGVPPELLKYEVEYAKRVGKYPIKRENFRHLDELEATARGA
ncbi:MAG: uroporphyrinogen decarboxylase family protein, partial [Thermofilaceae archaeon]